MCVQTPLARQRSSSEQFIVKALLNRSELSQKFNSDLIAHKRLGKIAKRIQSLVKRDGPLNLEVLKTHCEPLIDIDNNEALQYFRNQIAVHIEIDEYDFRKHCEILTDIAVKESLQTIARTTLERAQSIEETASDIIMSGNEILELKSRLPRERKVVSIGDAMDELMDQIITSRENDTDVGVPYPIKPLADHLYSMYPSDLVVIAARPATGKTALGLNLTDVDDPFGIVSTEMANAQLAMRYVSMESGIPAMKMRNARSLTDDELERVKVAAAKNKGRPIYFEDKGAINIGEIEETVEMWVNIAGAKVVIVDYAQRINSDQRHNSESERIGHVTKRLKELAKRLGICVVLLAQVNRDNVKENRRPSVHDIKGSGDIEQEADVIILMHKPNAGRLESQDSCIVEFIIDKNRHGEIGRVITRYEKGWMRFKSPNPEDIEAANSNYQEAA
ncbi:DnaB-like helicase C-terminal domain-containing protein [Vibrio alginolyticus]|uniref:DnaB-like helicase C-terminal domain-containing protein n=1 Tax=Vibrio TaxID=662 RepID=UPI0006CA738E|nr:DnaB-like helicase C-terminal domain-containing protein [Vibrio alginolyticus]KPM98503.1 hypothetical protein AOG25_08650 [Vibrio alginolyticus]CAH7146129.1 SF4 helicase domain-containing protein [Vibrio chagasii]CAH7317068.1 SF4 helicase domain-containing protein [Vibrio chagasii]